MKLAGNRYDLREVAGAFGDPGTLVPFLGASEHAPDGELLRSAQRYVMVLTAGVAMWNMGAGYLAGLALG